jgi:hypothetical protein
VKKCVCAVLLINRLNVVGVGQAFVEFVNEETAARAMQLHREPMGSRYVELFRSTKGEMMTAVQQRMYGMFSGVGGFSQFGAVSQVSCIVADICLET